MNHKQDSVDTIAAIATPPGRGGVGVIRVSGRLAIQIAKIITGKNLKVREATFTPFFDQENKIIDQGIAIYFAAPHSFTGEDVLELHGHGGVVVMELLLERTLELGARLARAGEFSERAFLNGKIDLAQAEAVADLIDASSVQAAKNATRSLQGEFSLQVAKLVEKFLQLRAQVELLIDFTEEEEAEKIVQDELFSDINDLLQDISALINQAKNSVLLQEGVKVVIVGDTNSGKSTLFNQLLGKDAAIVTDIHGTTRDVLHDTMLLDGLLVKLVDTAGFRDSLDPIEQEGIRRAQLEIQDADQLLWVVDYSLFSSHPGIDEITSSFKPQKFTVVLNKIDLTSEKERVEVIDGVNYIYLSAKSSRGMELLKKEIGKKAGLTNLTGGFSARKRHLDCLDRAAESLERALIQQDFELLAEELRQGQNYLGEITGKVASEDLLARIFSEFCVGK